MTLSVNKIKRFMMKNKTFYVFVIVVLCLAGGILAKKRRITSRFNEGEQVGFTTITAEEAEKIMKRGGDYVIVDVRSKKEYDHGHIPGAICIPSDSINNAPPAELPDFTQIILLYCRTGHRSRIVGQKLGSMGYINVDNFGGLNKWKGEVVKGNKTASK